MGRDEGTDPKSQQQPGAELPSLSQGWLRRRGAGLMPISLPKQQTHGPTAAQRCWRRQHLPALAWAAQEGALPSLPAGRQRYLQRHT